LSSLEKEPDDSELGLSVCFLGPLIDLPLRFVALQHLNSFNTPATPVTLQWRRAIQDPIEFPVGVNAPVLPDGILVATIDNFKFDLVRCLPLGGGAGRGGAAVHSHNSARAVLRQVMRYLFLMYYSAGF
jgi:hypothetical protein